MIYVSLSTRYKVRSMIRARIMKYIIAATYFLSRWSSLLAHPRRRIYLIYVITLQSFLPLSLWSSDYVPLPHPYDE
uniref:Uncharacterized protein n=1 Tax=Picea glauca TaxID=3330 RepID=A0A101LU61_PICGL|nr:hypothetical protein ABT39_MTgene2697 [Picea glauca]